jgi:hypothetical protein
VFYKLSQQRMKASTNSYIKNLVDADFVESYKNDNTPKATELYGDLCRGLKINGVSVVNHEGYFYVNDYNQFCTRYDFDCQLKCLKPVPDASEITNEEFRKILDAEFPGSFGDLPFYRVLLQQYTQSIAYSAVAPLEEMAQKVNMHIGENVQGINDGRNKETNIYFKNNRVFMSIELAAYHIIDQTTGQEHVIEGSKWVYLLEENGFKLMHANIYNETAFSMFLGYDAPSSLPEYPDYSMSRHVRDAFHEIFNPDKNEKYYTNDARAFFGMKSEANDDYNIMYEKIEKPLGILLSIPKNILKLVTEFLPLVVEKAAWKLIQNMDSIEIKFFRLFMTIPYVIYGLAWVTRQIGSRLTSPLRTFREAYAAGNEYHPALGVAFATVSGLLTVGTLIATGFAASAIFASAGVSAFAAADIWLSTHTAAVGSFLVAASTKAATLLGVSISSTAASIVAGSAIVSAMVTSVIAIREQFKTALSYMFQRKLSADAERAIMESVKQAQVAADLVEMEKAQKAEEALQIVKLKALVKEFDAEPAPAPDFKSSHDQILMGLDKRLMIKTNNSLVDSPIEEVNTPDTSHDYEAGQLSVLSLFKPISMKNIDSAMTDAELTRSKKRSKTV